LNKNIKLINLVLGSYEEFNLVIYNESKEYMPIFEDICIQINLKNIIYLYTDEDDYLKKKIAHMQCCYIGKGILRTLILNNIKTKNFLTTTTNLNKYQLKKSKFCNNYCYVFHSLVSINKAYEDKAFHSYDTIFAPTINHVVELNKYKSIHNLNSNILKSGYPLIDKISQTKFNNDKNDHTKILLAPSWGNNNFFTFNYVKILKDILQNTKYQITLRPHPHYYRKNKKKILKKLDELKIYKNFKLSIKYNFNDLTENEILISDMSGITIEFFLLNKLKIIYLDDSLKVKNENFASIASTTLEERIKKKIGIRVSTNQLSTFLKDFNKDDILLNKEVINQTTDIIGLYNFKKSAKSIIDYLENN